LHKLKNHNQITKLYAHNYTVYSIMTEL